MTQKRRLLVTGSTGKVGRMLFRHWSENAPESWDIQALSCRVAADGSLVGDIPPGDVVLALWGVTSGDDVARNALLGRRAIDIARISGAGVVLHASSAAVYAPGARLSETALPAPPRAYGRAKLDMEREVLTTDPPRSCLMRLANIAGADSLFSALGRNGTISLDRFASGHGPRRSYLSPRDLAAVALGLADMPSRHIPAILNVAGDDAVEMEAIARAAGRKIDWVEAPGDAIEQVALDTGLLRSVGLACPRSSDARLLVDDWQALERSA